MLRSISLIQKNGYVYDENISNEININEITLVFK